MAEEIALSFDSARPVCEEEHMACLREYLIKSFDALCKAVQCLLERSEQPELSAKFLSSGADCYVVSWMACSIASDGRASVQDCRTCKWHHFCWNHWRRLGGIFHPY